MHGSFNGVHLRAIIWTGSGQGADGAAVETVRILDKSEEFRRQLRLGRPALLILSSRTIEGWITKYSEDESGWLFEIGSAVPPEA